MFETLTLENIFNETIDVSLYRIRREYPSCFTANEVDHFWRDGNAFHVLDGFGTYIVNGDEVLELTADTDGEFYTAETIGTY